MNISKIKCSHRFLRLFLLYIYSQATCVLFCEQVKTVEWCGCLSPNVKYTIAGYSFCSSDTELSCNDAAYANFTAGDLIKNECLPKCPLECEQSVIDTVSSSYSFSFTKIYVDSVQTDANMIAKWGQSERFQFRFGIKYCTCHCLLSVIDIYPCGRRAQDDF